MILKKVSININNQQKPLIIIKGSAILRESFNTSEKFFYFIPSNYLNLPINELILIRKYVEDNFDILDDIIETSLIINN